MKTAKLLVTAVAMATMVIACSSTRTMHTSRSTYDSDRVASTKTTVVAKSTDDEIIVAAPAPVIQESVIVASPAPEPYVERVAKADRN